MRSVSTCREGVGLHKAADGQPEKQGRDIRQRFRGGSGKLRDDARFLHQAADHQGRDQRGRLRHEQADDHGDDDREEDHRGPRHRPRRVGHPDAALLAGREQPHDRRLDDWHETHVGVRRDRDRGEQLGGEQRRDVDAGRPVDGADDRDGRRLVQRKADDGGEQQRREDPQLTRGAQHGEDRLRQQGTEVHHRADTDEDEQREQFGLDAELVQQVEHAARLVHRRVRQVAQQHAEADRQQQRRLVLLGDGQVDEDAADGEHHEDSEVEGQPETPSAASG